MRLATPTTHRTTRRAATVVELAFVAVPFFMLLFGILEYGRFFLLTHVAANATRSGARLASVSTADVANNAAVIAEVNRMMVGLQNNLNGGPPNYDVSVFSVDQTQFPNIVPRASGNWNDAAFTQYIGVRITGTYRPIAAQLLRMPASIPITVTAITNSEAN